MGVAADGGGRPVLQFALALNFWGAFLKGSGFVARLIEIESTSDAVAAAAVRPDRRDRCAVLAWDRSWLGAERAVGKCRKTVLGFGLYNR